MNLDHIPEVSATRLRWRAILAALPESLLHTVRRLTGSEHRSYLVMNGIVLARFVSPQARLEFVNWVAATHRATSDYSFAMGKEFAVATQIQHGLDYITKTYGDADTGAPGPD